MGSILVIILLVIAKLFSVSTADGILTDQGRAIGITYSHQTGGQSHAPVRVAFLFAGSIRSFIYPLVHNSIRQNLLLAFCPDDLTRSDGTSHCTFDAFIRFSTADNQQAGLNASGTLVYHTGESVMNITRLLRNVMSPPTTTGHHPGSVMVKCVEVGGIEEANEMDAVATEAGEVAGHKDLHELYRRLDGRRYSMYFNRWMVYQMAVRHEQATSLTHGPYVSYPLYVSLLLHRVITASIASMSTSMCPTAV
jgi:hypothetical protein